MNKVLWSLFIGILVGVFLSPLASQAQAIHVGLQARPSVGGVFTEYARKDEKGNQLETSIVFTGTGWVAKSGLDLSWWITNAHVARTEGYDPPKPLVDSKKRWWFPTGRLIVKGRDGVARPTIRIVSDEKADLAALQVRGSFPFLIVKSDQGLLPTHRVVVVGNPMGLRSVVTTGEITQEVGGGYDEGDFPKEDNKCGEKKDPFSSGIFLHSAPITFGSSGSPILSIETAAVIGVVRGFFAAGDCMFFVGQTYGYGISGKTVLDFVSKIP